MILTARYAHLDSLPRWKVGEEINENTIIGRMGNSGQSTAAHLHLDLTRGENAGMYSLHDIEAEKPAAAPVKQLLYFLDDDMFSVPLVVTTAYAELDYYLQTRKVHHGFDLVPVDRRVTKDHYDIHWNRSMPGRVIRVANDPYGYGYHICIAFEV
jgi:murein DD-endopeptidase MepM/ murein hydrolase activator NlpD